MGLHTAENGLIGRLTARLKSVSDLGVGTLAKRQIDGNGRNGRTVLTVSEVADWLRVHPQTVYRWAHEGKLPGFQLGGTWRFASDIIDRWINEQTLTVR